MNNTNVVVSESARETAENIRQAYTHTPDGRITQPGKFEGEPIFAPYYWQAGLEGFADSDNGTAFGFRFSNAGDDFTLWPELKKWLGRKRAMKLYEDDNGFVRCC